MARWSQSIVWTDFNGDRHTASAEGIEGEELKDVRAAAVRVATRNGWTPPRWWQFWRWSDTRIPPVGDTELKQLLLSIISDLQGEGYGVSISREIEARTGKDISIGKLYAALGELEEEGLIAGEQRVGGAERRYLEKRVYRLTGHGLAEVKGSHGGN